MGTRGLHVVCRLCLHESDYLTNIFEVNVNQSCVLAEVIADLLQFPVSKNDGYPQHVCSNCSDKLIAFTIFKEQCQESKSAYDYLFASRKCREEEEREEGSVTLSPVTVKSEPVDEVDSDEIEIQVEPHASSSIKEEIVVDDAPNQEEACQSRWVWNGSNLVMEAVEAKEDAIDGEENTVDVEGDVYQESCMLEQGIQSRIINVQSLADARNGCYPVSTHHKVEIWQPIKETAEERKRRLNRDRIRKFRSNQTPEQVLRRRMLDTRRAAVRRSNETPEERERRRMMDAHRAAIRRLNETPEQRAERRRLDKVRHALWRRKNVGRGVEGQDSQWAPQVSWKGGEGEAPARAPPPREDSLQWLAASVKKTFGDIILSKQ